MPDSAQRGTVERAVEDTVAAIRRRRSIVRLAADDIEVRYIARKAARLALGMERNPDRAASDQKRRDEDG